MNYLFWATKKKRVQRAQKIFNLLEDKIAKSHQILNVGCGDGYLEKFIIEKYDSKITGIDTKQNENYPVNLIVGNFEEINLPVSNFDIIIFSLSLHHIKNPEKVLLKAKQLLKNDGLLFILEIAPKHTILKTLLFKARILCFNRVHTWTESELLDLLTNTGFKIIKKEYTPVQGIIIHAKI